MSDCECCDLMSYHGISREGRLSTIYGWCEKFGHNRPLDCSLFEEGRPKLYDERGIEIMPEEHATITDRSAELA